MKIAISGVTGMNGLVMVFALGAIAAGCCCVCGKSECADKTRFSMSCGHNEIILYTDPLSFEARRDGAVVVARTEIGMKVNGRCLGGKLEAVADELDMPGLDIRRESTPVYKKASVVTDVRSRYIGFGDWGVRIAAREDGVAYRFETKMSGEITVNCEKAGVTVPDAKAECWVNRTGNYGQEESVCAALKADEVKTVETVIDGWKGERMIYLPFVYTAGGKTVAFTESDVFDYPVLNLESTSDRANGVRFKSLFAGWPAKKHHAFDGAGFKPIPSEEGGRWIKISEYSDYLVKTAGTRTFPWRVFIAVDSPAQLCESDAVYALARPAAKGADFSWVKPGKVAWDWWNCFDNQGPTGCNTKTYERFIDFASKTGVEYVIFDEGWSERLNIWKFHPDVDVPHLIKYAEKKGVGIILWMAWAQIAGDEEKVASHFAKLGAKGFKVDFMDRGDAEAERFLWDFAEACAKNRMIIDYHGAHRPTGMSRAYPNVVNYEGIHGNEQMKWYDNSYDFLANDVRAFFCRLTAGPMDYTPGAMLNHLADGSDYSPVKPGVKSDEAAATDISFFPGTLGTRCRQMAMMALYEAPLQMLCDSPSNYEKNEECFKFMAATPVVWNATVGLGGTPDTYAAAARLAKDGSWYAAGIGNRSARDIEIDLSKFLGEGEWIAEIFRDAPDSDKKPVNYVHQSEPVKGNGKLALHLAPGGGFVMRFCKSVKASR